MRLRAESLQPHTCSTYDSLNAPWRRLAS